MTQYVDPPTAKVTLTFLIDAWSDDRVSDVLERIQDYLDAQTEPRAVKVDWEWT